MKQTRKILALLLAMVMALGLMAPAFAVEVPAEGNSFEGTLVIIHVNDSHGRDVAAAGSSIGTAGIAQLVADYEAAGAEVLLMHAGDATQGTPLVNYEQGAKAIEFMNAAGYDVMTLGNHEFDWGTQNLKDITKDIQFPIVSANTIDTATGKPMFEAHTIFETALGIKVGVFGVTTPETATKAHPDKVIGTSFLAGDDMFAVAQKEVDALKAAGCDLIVALGHLGVSDESIGNRSYDLLAKVTGIDLFIDGHSHTVIENGEMVGDTLLVSTGEYLNNAGVVTFKNGVLTAGLISASDYNKVDETVAALINDYNAGLDEKLVAAVIGKSEVVLDGNRAPGVRTQETNLGDFAADAILWYARKDLGEANVDAALTNGGGIRDTIQAGDVNMKHMITVFPFGNTVATVSITGAALLDALEAATWSTPDAIGAFPQVAGMSFTIDTSVEYVNGEPYSTYFMPANPGSRIKNLMINGKPVDLNKTYVIATNDFTAAGGDTYGPFVGAPLFNTGLAMEDALIAYVAEELGGVISAAQYGAPAGRINIIPADVKAGQWYTDAVYYVMDEGMMLSTGGGKFDLTGTVTRATVFEVLYRLEGKPAVSGGSFADVAATDWFAASAAWAKEIGITTGTNVGYEGNKAVTRQELAKIFADYLDFKGFALPNANLSTYADHLTVAQWAWDGMVKSVGVGIINGSNNNLNPTATASRVELAQMLFNMSKAELTEKGPEPEFPTIETTVETVSKYGNLELVLDSDALYAAGFAVGDMLEVHLNGKGSFVVAPLCTNYSDVDNGAIVVRAQPGGKVIVAINMGNFAGTYDGEEITSVVFVLREAGAYLEEYEIRNLTRTNNRADYASDAVFANFRSVAQGGIAAGVLYRASSPINEEIGRASFADKLSADAGIATFINLADNDESMAAHLAADTFASPYYKGVYEAGGVILLDMGVDFKAADFKAKLATGLTFLAEQKGPYLIHCNEGKDRAGFTIALLQALMGATAEEIGEDYMTTYTNFYGVEKGTTKYTKIMEGNIMESLREICKLNSGASLAGEDLALGATNYLYDIGLTADQIAAIQTNLSTAIAVPAAA